MTTRDLNLDGEIFSLPSTLVDAIEEAGRQRSEAQMGECRLASVESPTAVQPLARTAHPAPHALGQIPPLGDGWVPRLHVEGRNTVEADISVNSHAGNKSEETK